MGALASRARKQAMSRSVPKITPLRSWLVAYARRWVRLRAARVSKRFSGRSENHSLTVVARKLPNGRSLTVAARKPRRDGCACEPRA